LRKVCCGVRREACQVYADLRRVARNGLGVEDWALGRIGG